MLFLLLLQPWSPFCFFITDRSTPAFVDLSGNNNAAHASEFEQITFNIKNTCKETYLNPLGQSVQDFVRIVLYIFLWISLPHFKKRKLSLTQAPPMEPFNFRPSTTNWYVVRDALQNQIPFQTLQVYPSENPLVKPKAATSSKHNASLKWALLAVWK